MHAERRMRKGSMGRRGRLKAESGTCNVCSAPCSSCMHNNLSLMGSKSGESSDGTCRGPIASQCSMNEDDALLSSRDKAHNNSNFTASEASNLVSLNSYNDSSSENAGSRAVVRSPEASGDSEDTGKRGKISSSGIGIENLQNSEFNGDLGQVIVSDKARSSKCIEDHEDAFSFNPGSIGFSKVQIDLARLKKCNLSHGFSNKAESQGVNDDDFCTRGENNQNCGAESSKPGERSTSQNSDQNDSDFKPGKRDQTHDTTELNSQAISEDENDDTELLEHDVKVCDICGDAGREDLLAICSRCSDGAEHTYCMREMLQKVPEGEWLCEECKFSVEAEKQKQVSAAREKRESKVQAVSQSFGKRLAENLEAAPVAKRRAIGTSTGSPKAVISRHDALSRNSSFKCTGKVKTKLAHQTSFDYRHSGNVENVRSAGSNLQPPKGTLFKSKSFNSMNLKPKVKLVDDAVLPRQKGAKEYTSLDMKEGCSRKISKSMSFKSTNVGSSCSSDLKVKTIPSKFSHPQEVLGIKQVKDRSRYEKKDMSKSDCSGGCSKTASSTVSTSKVDLRLTPGDSESLVNASNSRDLKGLQSDFKSSCLTKQASSLTRNRVEAKASTTNRSYGSAERNSNQTITRDEPPSTSSESAEGHSGNTDGISQDVLSRHRESRNLGQKTGAAVVNRPRSSLLSSSKGIPSQKDGHTAEQGSTGALAPSALDPSSTKNFSDEKGKSNRLRAAVDAALRKKPDFVKNRALDQSDGLSVSNSELSSDRSFHSRLPVSNMGKNSIFGQERKGPLNFHASDLFKQTTARSEHHLAFPSTDTRPILREWPLAAISILSKTSVVPDHEYIWQGGLDLQRERSLPESHSGIQAHLSNFAASKVRDVVQKMPERIPLSEVPRSTIWPVQFHENGAKEDHIALFFFAKDIESYEKNYKPLVDNMMKKDLALIGNFHNVELLIFASNQLPRNFQRWNMFFFLWGVFRGRKDSLSNLPKKKCIPGLDVLHQNRGLSHVLPQNSSSSHVQKESAICESLYNATVSSEHVIADEDQKNKDFITESMHPEVNPKQLGFISKFVSSSMLGSPKDGNALLEPGLEINSTPLQIVGGPLSVENLSREVHPFDNQETGDGISVRDEKMQIDDSPAACGRNSEVCYTRRENIPSEDPSCNEGNHRKRSYMELTEPETSSAKKDKAPLTDLNTMFADVGSFNKKMRTDPEVDNVGISSGSIFTKGSVPPQNSNLDSSSSSVNKRPTSDDENRIQNMNQSERFVFPVDLNQGCDEQQLNVGVPDLELTVQADILPLFTGADDRDAQYNREKEKEDDIAASLSLSLSFPFPDKEEEKEPGTGRHNVNTSLLLFRGLADK